MKFCTSCGTEYPDDVLFCQKDGTTLRGAGGANDLVGQVLAERYHIKKKLGEGGMGQVYLAEHVKMGRRCAVKIMSAGLSNDPEAVGRFNREAANASRIAHPNVCAIYDFGETSEGLIYLAMEFIEGQSLTDFLHETGPLPLPRAAVILTQAAEALQSAHDLGIVHRDLKPDNIMITGVRGRDVVKVVDFGIAKATGSDSISQKVTRTGLVVGTPEYMSPEQLTGDALDGRSDIYSLALVFYRMLTGVLPFKSDSAQEAMVKRLTEDPAPLSVAYPAGRFPPRLQEVVNRALARSPMERYASAAEFGRDVHAVAGTMTGTVDTESATQAVKRMSGASPTVPQTRIDPMAQVGRPGKVSDTTPARPISMPVPQHKRSMVVPVAGGIAVVLALGGGAWALKGRLGGAPTVPDSTAQGSLSRDTTTRTVDTTTRPPPPVVPQPVNGVTQARTDTTNLIKPVVKPASGQTHTDTVRPAGGGTTPANGGGKQDLSAITRQVHDLATDFEWPDDPVKRADAKALGQRAYDIHDLPDKVRAEAAFVVSQAMIGDWARAGAADWMEKAVQLDDRPVWRNLLNTYRNQ
jgi:serine/threonine-protein kinase